MDKDLNNEKGLENLISFIREEIGEFNMSINETTLIEDGLGVTGGDGIDLIQRFSEKYNIDISDFDFSKYFYPEPNFFNSYGKIEPLTVGDLFLSFKTGKLR